MMDFFRKNLKRKEYASIKNKLQLKNEFSMQKYLQATSEINVLYYVLRKYNNEFKYEPKYNGGNNPECAFKHVGRIVNIEVKCPDMEKRISAENRNTVGIYVAERIPDHKKIFSEIEKIAEPNLAENGFEGIEEIFRMDNKLKDYLVSGQKNFPVSCSSYFNILVIALETVLDMDEWYSYIFGDQGVFTNNSLVKDNYDRIDAILLTGSVYGHKAWREFANVDVWKLEETINLLFLDLNKQKSETENYYSNVAIDFFEFLEKLDEKWKDYNSNDRLNCIYFKIEELQIIYEFYEYMKNGYKLLES